MASENMSIHKNSDWHIKQSAPRRELRLTAKERKLLLVFVDLVLVNGMLLLSVTLWNEFTPSVLSLFIYSKWFITVSFLWFILGTVLDIYNLARAASWTSILASVGIAAFVTTLLFLAIPWLSPLILHRTYALGFVLLTTITLAAWRMFYAHILVQTALPQRGMIVGGDVQALALAKTILHGAEDDGDHSLDGIGYEIVGRVIDRPGDVASADIPLLGDVRKLVRLARQHAVDEIIITPDDERELSLETREILLDCRELGLRISSLASIYERLTGRLPVDYARYDLQLLLSPMDSPEFRLYLAFKRALDVVLAFIGLLGLGCVMPIVALTNALTSPGPLFYRQERLGKGGRPFTVLKFRSMVMNAERYGAVWAGKNDPRITPIGRFLRKTRLDEVPQFINVLRGEMSFVGPRPERPHFVGQLARTFPLYRARHAVKPGITGWAQVRYEYGDSVEDARVKLEHDLYYVKHASFYLDLLIMLHTVRIIIGFKGR